MGRPKSAPPLADGGLDEASHEVTLGIIGKVFGRVMTASELASLF